MPLKIFGLACAVVVLSSPLARAQINFDDLFNSIAFSDDAPPPLPVEPPPQPPSASAPSASAPSASAPSASEPAASEPAASERSPEQVPLGEWDQSERGLLLSPAAPILSAPGLSAPGLSEPVQTYPSEDFARDRSAPSAEGCAERIDFDALLSNADEAPTRLYSPPHPLAAPSHLTPSHLTPSHLTPSHLTPSHLTRAHRPSAGPPSCATPCRHPARGSQPECETCITYTRPTPCLQYPNLPPPTSAEAYYRTPACYRDLWGGYHQQRQHACQSHHKHLHGHCHCLGSEHPHAPLPHASHPVSSGPPHQANPGLEHPSYLHSSSPHPDRGHPDRGHPDRGNSAAASPALGSRPPGEAIR